MFIGKVLFLKSYDNIRCKNFNRPAPNTFNTFKIQIEKHLNITNI